MGEKEFMLGYLTILDFKISELSYYIEKISKETYDKYPFLRRAREAVEALPEIKAYYETEKAMKGPFLPPQMAVIKMWWSIQNPYFINWFKTENLYLSILFDPQLSFSHLYQYFFNP